MRTLCPRAHFFFIFCCSQLQGEKGKTKEKTAHQYRSLKEKGPQELATSSVVLLLAVTGVKARNAALAVYDDNLGHR